VLTIAGVLCCRANAFNSAQEGQSFWGAQTEYMRTALRYTQFKVSL
jgi:hypothetical protein